MTAAVVLLSGCGNMTMLEEYSFGYVQLKAGNSEVYVMTPFDLAHVSRQNGEGMMYINNDKHQCRRCLRNGWRNDACSHGKGIRCHAETDTGCF